MNLKEKGKSEKEKVEPRGISLTWFKLQTIFYFSKNTKMAHHKILLSNTDYIPGKEVIEVIDIARGNTVRARNIGRDIMAGLRNIVGGEIPEYTKLLADSREHALQRMLADAERIGADAVINVRFVTSMVNQHAAEILAYGTAVKLK